MKIEKVSGKEERTVLTGMIVDRSVLSRIAGKWTHDMFQSRWANIVGQWCVDFFIRYGEPPKKSMQGLFESWASENQDKETIALVEKFLTGLSDEYETLAKESNSEYVVDVAGKHFKRVGLQRLAETIQGDLDMGKVDMAKSRIAKFRVPEMGLGSGIDVLRDEDAIRQAFQDDLDPLIEYPGDLGTFFKGQLQRDCFVAVMASEKRGKSWWLEDMAWRAMQQRRKVAFFNAGDLTEHQMMRRFMLRASRHPKKAGTIKYPKDIKKMKDEVYAQVQIEKKIFKEDLSWQMAARACVEVIEKTKTKETLLKLCSHSTGTLSVEIIDSTLDEWERDGWAADVIVVDYADIMKREKRQDARDQTNDNWMGLRGLSQRRHSLVITGTQANTGSYTKKVLSRANFSEDHRKLAHVTGMYALNQDEEEKRCGVMRLNWIVLRESEFFESQCCHVAGCLDIANPAIRSTF